MRYFILIFSIAILTCSRKADKQNSLNDTTIVYNQDQMYRIMNGAMKIPDTSRLKIVDTACINEEKRAYDDIKNGKVVHYIFLGMTEMYRSDKEMAEILSQYNIRTDSASTSCFPPLKGFSTNCYISVMDKEIEKRHGKNFIDSIRVQAERKYVSSHPDIVYEFQECDTVSRYPGTKNYPDFFDKPPADFAKIFQYPKNYQYKTEPYFSSTDVQFILMKTGEIKNIVTDVTFQNPKNEPFEKHFRENAEQFVKSVKWIPATKKGIKVNSEVHFIFFHK